jgi:hypothetical protein
MLGCHSCCGNSSRDCEDSIQEEEEEGKRKGKGSKPYNNEFHWWHGCSSSAGATRRGAQRICSPTAARSERFEDYASVLSN